MFRQVLEDLANHDFKYVPKEEKLIDLSLYTACQVNELKCFLHCIRKVIDGIELPNEVQGKGRPSSDAKDLVKVILVQQYFWVSERAAIGL